MKTPFYRAAETAHIKDHVFYYSEQSRIFANLWFPEKISWITDYDHKVLLLLFADLLWQEEMKGEKK